MQNRKNRSVWKLASNIDLLFYVLYGECRNIDGCAASVDVAWLKVTFLH